MKKIFIYLFMAALLTSPSFLNAQPAGAGAVALPQEAGLEEMLFRQIEPVAIGTLTETDVKRNPASTTIITSEMIEMTPARNIYDLLEIYVPNCSYVTHFDSTHVGVRGLIADRDYRSLLLLNGRLINQKATNGMITELENWDLNDIERIEVVRGPGSVTYGPGAITSVINIITKDSVTGKGLKAGATYVSGYNSSGGYFSLGRAFKDMSIFTYMSCRRTIGADADIYYMDPRVAGSGGKIGGSGLYGRFDPASYYPDTADEPQLKFHTQIDFLKELSLYLRYTNSGTSRIRAWTEWPYTDRVNVGKFSLNGEQLNGSETRNRQFFVALEDKHVFSNDTTLKSLISFDSMDGYRRQFDDTWTSIINGQGNPDPKHPANMAWSYSESKLMLQSTLNFDFLEKHKGAIGAEYSYESYGPGWGQSSDDTVIFDGSVILCSPSAKYLQYNPFYTNVYFTKKDGFHLYNYAFFEEFNIKATDDLSLLLSARLDKNRFSRYLISPRVSGVWDAKKFGIFKLTWQESIRTPTAVNLYLQGRAGNKADPEQLRTVEFDYSKSVGKFDLSFACFRNQLKAISWDSTAQTSKVNGRLRNWGTEFELAYKTEKHTVGFNYAYSKQLNWEMSNATDATGISTSDYYQSYSLPAGMVLRSWGNDLLNWPNHMAKLYTINQLTKKWKMFFECCMFWDYAGEKAWMTMWENAAHGTASEAIVVDNIQRLRDSNIYDFDFRANLAFKYQINEHISTSIFGMNILPLGSNHRYQYMQQSLVAIKEPTVCGIRIDYKY